MPDAIDLAELPNTDVARGLILGYQTESYGCTILTYADGRLSKRGTFEAPTAKNKSSLTGCGVQRQYTSDYGARWADSYANYVDANTHDRHVLVQEIDQAGQRVRCRDPLQSR